MDEHPWQRWGDPARRPTLPRRAERLLRSELGLTGRSREPVALGDVHLPESRLSDALRERFGRIVGPDRVRTGREARVRRAAGASYLDLVRLRTGALVDAPDAVLAPGSHEEVRELLELCAAERVAVVPFGGGTSVVGGVAPLREQFPTLVSLDLQRMDRLVEVDPESLTATFQPGMTGPAAEEALAGHGLTLGHFPQSFERATIGGYVATRSAGQASTGYGRIDDLVEGLRVATPSGDLDLGRAPRSAAGPDLRALLVGSEGALGVITEVTLRVHRAPATRRYEGWSLPTFTAGATAFRALVQGGMAPDVARLSDEEETRVTLAQVDGAKGTAVRGWLRLRGHASGSLVIVGFEGGDRLVSRRRRHASAVLRGHGGICLGQATGEAWRHGRFSGPYLRDELLDRGALVETLETATSWSRLVDVYRTTAAALHAGFAEQGTPGLVLCHISHLYPTGASLYFTVLAPAKRGGEVAQWQALKRRAGDAIAGAGATITHHHAVGADHLPWMRAEVGDVGLAALRAVKDRLDPVGILNPGKLIPGDR